MSDVDPRPPMGDLLDRLIREAENTPPAETSGTAPPVPSDTVSASPSGQNSTPSGNLLNGLLSNPALLSALPQLIKGLGGLSHPPTIRATAEEAASAASQETEEASSASVPTAVRGHGSSGHSAALLCALKPYLGSDRRQAVDYMISLCRVWDTLQGMGISLPLLLSSTPPQDGDREV